MVARVRVRDIHVEVCSGRQRERKAIYAITVLGRERITKRGPGGDSELAQQVPSRSCKEGDSISEVGRPPPPTPASSPTAVSSRPYWEPSSLQVSPPSRSCKEGDWTLIWEPLRPPDLPAVVARFRVRVIYVKSCSRRQGIQKVIYVIKVLGRQRITKS